MLATRAGLLAKAKAAASTTAVDSSAPGQTGPKARTAASVITRAATVSVRSTVTGSAITNRETTGREGGEINLILATTATTETRENVLRTRIADEAPLAASKKGAAIRKRTGVERSGNSTGWGTRENAPSMATRLAATGLQAARASTRAAIREAISGLAIIGAKTAVIIGCIDFKSCRGKRIAALPTR